METHRETNKETHRGEDDRGTERVRGRGRERSSLQQCAKWEGRGNK